MLDSTGDKPGELQASEELRGIAADLEKVSSTDDVLQVLAESYSSVATTLDNMGNIPASQEAWRKAAAIRRTLADANPTNPRFQLELAKSYYDLGVQVMMPWPDMEEALIVQEKGVEILEKLVQDHPTSTEYRYRLASAVESVGWAQSVMLWKPKEAEASLNAALALWLNITESFPAVNFYQGELAEEYTFLGLFLDYSGRWPKALEYHRKSVAIFQRLVENNRGTVFNRAELALSYAGLGTALQEMGRESEAMEALQRSVTMAEKAVEADPASAHNRMYLARTRELFGALLERVGKPGDARNAYSKAYALRRRNAEALHEDAWAQRDLAENRSLFGRLCRDTGTLPEAARRRADSAADPTETRRRRAD